jgi:two-component system cell cycle sensor histidine kinase/response regulator CckA
METTDAMTVGEDRALLRGLRGHEILVVDDDAEMRAMLSMAFERRGINTHVAESGREALALLKRGQRYCAVLLDLNVPAPDGIEIAKYIRDNDPTLPVIVISGHPDLADRIKDADLGAVVKMILMKPLDVMSLVNFVHGSGCVRTD